MLMVLVLLTNKAWCVTLARVVWESNKGRFGDENLESGTELLKLKCSLISNVMQAFRLLIYMEADHLVLIRTK